MTLEKKTKNCSYDKLECGNHLDSYDIFCRNTDNTHVGREKLMTL